VSRRAWPAGLGVLLLAASAGATETGIDRHKPWLLRQRGLAEPSDERAPEPASGSPAAGDEPGQRLFLRLGLGSGWFGASSGEPRDTRSFSGVPVSVDVQVGGRLSAELCAGVGYLRDEILGLSSEDEVLDGDEPDLRGTSFAMHALGPFLAYAPATSGPHAFAQVGYGVLGVTGVETEDPSGPAFALGGGYDWDVDERWAIGAGGRLLIGGLTTEEFGDANDVLVWIPSVSLSVTYR
jgi:hypothetical protein